MNIMAAFAPCRARLFCVVVLALSACSAPKPAATSRENSPPAKESSHDESAQKSTDASARFHITGVLLNKDRSPSVDKSVVMEEISRSAGKREATIRFGVVEGEMKLTSPRAKTDSSGRFDIEVDPSQIDATKEFGLTVLDLSSPRSGPPRTPPFLSVGGKPVTLKIEGPPREIKLGEILTK